MNYSPSQVELCCISRNVTTASGTLWSPIKVRFCCAPQNITTISGTMGTSYLSHSKATFVAYRKTTTIAGTMRASHSRTPSSQVTLEARVMRCFWAVAHRRMYQLCDNIVVVKFVPGLVLQPSSNDRLSIPRGDGYFTIPVTNTDVPTSW